MATYLYGLLLSRNASRLKHPITGINGVPVRVLRSGQIDALVASLDAAPQPRLDDIRAHDAVVQAAVDAGVTVAAARFGQTFPDDGACAKHVAERADKLLPFLEENDGCVEMRLLTVSRTPEPDVAVPADSSPGRAYLERLRAEHNRTASLSVREAIGDVVRAEVVEELPTWRVAISHLICAADQAAYRAAVARVASVAGSRIVGPLALYAFVDQ